VAAIPSTQVVYFFFEETASEFEFFEKLRISRVAQVCKVDSLVGGGAGRGEANGGDGRGGAGRLGSNGVRGGLEGVVTRGQWGHPLTLRLCP